MNIKLNDSMTESVESTGGAPCPKSSASDLKKLYIDLCNLIVESRIPGANERGYGDGLHCPPATGDNTHLCDFTKLECQKHQRLMCHLLGAVRSNIFEIEVIMLPECCADSKLKERIEKKEFTLLEKWSLQYIYGNVEAPLDVSQLLRAVRSFLHFSQISAWLSSTKGKNPSNIYYWVKPNLDGLETSFEKEPEVHSFPVCKITEDFYCCVKVKYPPRTEYLPIVPCSKHPPVCGYSIKTAEDSPGFSRSVSFNPQIMRQLQKSCDQGVISARSYSPKPSPLMLTPTILKTFSGNIDESKKPKRALQLANCQDTLLSTCNLPYDLSKSKLNKNKSIDVLPNPQASYVCNFAQTYTDALSQENICFDSGQFTSRFRIRLGRFGDNALDSDEITAGDAFSNVSRSPLKYSPEYMGLSHQVTNSSLTVTPNDNSIALKTYTSPSRMIPYQHALLMKQHTITKNIKEMKAVKRKVSDWEPFTILPRKKMYCDTTSSLISNSLTDHSEAFSNYPFYTSQDKNDALQNNLNTSIKSSTLNDIFLQYRSEALSNNLSSKPLPSSLKTCCQLMECGHNASQQNVMKDSLNKSYSSLGKRPADVLSRIGSIKTFSKKSCVSYACEENSKRKIDESDIKTFSKKSCVSYACEENSKRKIDENDIKLNSVLFNTSNISSFKNVPFNSSNNSTLNEYVLLSKMSAVKQTDTKDEAFSEPFPTTSCDSTTNSQYLGGYGVLQRYLFESKLFHSIPNQKPDFRVNYRNSCSFYSKKISKISRRLSSRKLKRHNAKIELASNGSTKSSYSSKISEKRRNILYKRNIALSTSISKLVLAYKSNESIGHFTGKRFKCDGKLSSQISIKRDDGITSNSTCGISDISLNMNSIENMCSVNSTDVSRISSDSFQTGDKKNTSAKTSGRRLFQDANSSSWNSEPFIPKYAQRAIAFNAVLPSTTRCPPFRVTESLECFPRHISKFPKSKRLLINFEESILKGCLPILSSVTGFYAKIGASGSFFPSHLTLPADVSFYQLGNCHQGAAPYVAHVTLTDAEYFLPKKGAVQVTLFNPSDTVVKMFVVNYDLSSMPPLCHTFIRQKIYSLPVGSTEELPASQKWLRFIVHLRFASSKSGKIFLHNGFKIVVLNKSNDDAASEFSQEPRELRSFISVPQNPTFSNF